MSAKNSKEEIEDVKTKRLKQKVRRLERENKRLRSQNRTLNNAWNKAEEQLIVASDSKSIEQVFKEVDSNSDKIKQPCPNCKYHTMFTKNQGDVVIVRCNRCGYRNRVDERGIS